MSKWVPFKENWRPAIFSHQPFFLVPLLFVMLSLCPSPSDIPAAPRGFSDITSPSWCASTFCCSSSSVPSTQPPSFPPGTDCSSDGEKKGSAGLKVHGSIVPSWSERPEALAMQTIYAHFILFPLSSHYFFAVNTSFLGYLICLGILMQWLACNLSRFVKTKQKKSAYIRWVNLVSNKFLHQNYLKIVKFLIYYCEG